MKPASTARPSLEVVASHGDWDTLLANAVRVLTDAARLRRSVLERDDDGTWSASATQSEQADWAEFVTLAVAGAAANVGSTETALAGRPGSWEAEAVRSMLASTVGVDDEHLMDHRREPIRVTVCVEDMLEGTEIARRYDEAFDAADAQDWAEHVAYWKRLSNSSGSTAARSRAAGWLSTRKHRPFRLRSGARTRDVRA